jgi:hypothetical protein
MATSGPRVAVSSPQRRTPVASSREAFEVHSRTAKGNRLAKTHGPNLAADLNSALRVSDARSLSELPGGMQPGVIKMTKVPHMLTLMPLPNKVRHFLLVMNEGNPSV